MRREPWPEGRRLALLGAVAAALAVAAAASVAPRLVPPPARPFDPLVAINPALVRAIEVDRGEVRGRFVRSGAGWELAARGRTEPVDADLPEGFLRSLAGLGRLALFASPDVAAFGLAPPRGAIAIENGGTVRIALGDRNPPLTALYVKVLPRPEVVLVGSVLLWEFEKLAGLVTRQVARPPSPADPALRR